MVADQNVSVATAVTIRFCFELPVDGNVPYGLGGVGREGLQALRTSCTSSFSQISKNREAFPWLQSCFYTVSLITVAPRQPSHRTVESSVLAVTTSSSQAPVPLKSTIRRLFHRRDHDVQARNVRYLPYVQRSLSLRPTILLYPARLPRHSFGRRPVAKVIHSAWHRQEIMVGMRLACPNGDGQDPYRRTVHV